MPKRTDTTLVLAESAVDALSYAALHFEKHTRYASFGGAISPRQLALIRAAIERLSLGAVVRIATDNDDEGADFAATIERLAAETRRRDLTVARAASVDAKEWNEVLLRAEGAGFFS